MQNIYQKFFHKISRLRKEFFRKVILQLNDLLKYKILISVKQEKPLFWVGAHRSQPTTGQSCSPPDPASSLSRREPPRSLKSRQDRPPPHPLGPPSPIPHQAAAKGRPEPGGVSYPARNGGSPATSWYMMHPSAQRSELYGKRKHRRVTFVTSEASTAHVPPSVHATRFSF